MEDLWSTYGIRIQLLWNNTPTTRQQHGGGRLAASLGGEHGRIRAQDVELLTPTLAEEHVFTLVNAIAARDAAKALSVLHELVVNQREPPLRLMALLHQSTLTAIAVKTYHQEVLCAAWRLNGR